MSLETTFDTYIVDELIGQGGAGRVYGGTASDRVDVAVKVLIADQATKDKRCRFRNEIAFLSRNRHRNIVTVIDHGVASNNGIAGPFYVMRRYDSSLREIMREGITPDRVLPLFVQMLDGVEAAHLQGVCHRDLKPENMLYNEKTSTLAIADFGTAHFTEELLVTAVDTRPAQRLANFQYAAPEQRTPGKPVTAAADIYALGLMLNEMFTGAVPHGTDYRQIAQVSKEQAFLDGMVERMLRQNPDERPAKISDIKGLLQKYQTEAVSLQRLSQISGEVVKSEEIDDPLALTPPKLVNFDWSPGLLTLFLDRSVTRNWVEALYEMGSYSCVMGKPPKAFTFDGDRARVQADEYQVQDVIDYFKQWLPNASAILKSRLEQAAESERKARVEKLRRERAVEEQRLRVLRQAHV